MSKQNTIGRWCLLLVVVAVLIAPIFVIAADPNVAGGNTEQWTDTECKTVGGDYDAGGKACYAKPPVANLGVAIGGLKQATLSQYVAAVYKYMVAAAAVLAVIFIMIGGFRWITAAGGEQVGAARKMIVNAVVGMILAFSSYILLQTVNPATLSLTPPRIKLVKARYLDKLKPANMIGDVCYTIKDKEACANSCIAAGLDKAVCECTVIPETAYTIFAKIAVGGATILATGPGLVASAVKEVTTKVFPSMLKYGLKNIDRIIAVGVVASLASEGDPGKKGICLPFAVRNLEVGEVCSLSHPDGCVESAKCVSINPEPPFGMCVSGKENTGCTQKSDCQANLDCCIVSFNLGTCQQNCAKRPNGAVCTTGTMCESGNCSVAAGGQGVCSAGGAGTLCTSNGNCTGSGLYCPTSYYDLSAGGAGINPYQQCSALGGANAICCSGSECATGTCAGATPDSPVAGKCRIIGNGTCPGCGRCQ